MDHNIIKNMVEDGFAARKIAFILKHNETEIRKIINDNNFILRKDIFSDNKIENIINLYEAGVSAKTLGIKYSVDKKKIQNCVEKHGKLRSKNEAHRIIRLNHDIFNEVDTIEKSYWFGFFYSNAYVNLNLNTTILSFKKSNYEHIDKLCKFLSLDLTLKSSILKQNKRIDNIRVYSKEICEKLISSGSKLKEAIFPIWLDKSLYFHFLRGFIDGGGGELYLNKKNNQTQITIKSSEKFCNNVVDIINYVACIDVENKFGEIKINENSKIYELLNFTYRGSFENIRLNSNYEFYKDFLSTYVAEKENKNVLKIDFVKYGLSSEKTDYLKPINIDGNILTAAYIEKLSLDEREKLVQPIFRFFRKQGLIYADYDKIELIKQYESLKNIEIDLNINELDNKYSLSTAICRYFCKSYYTTTRPNEMTIEQIWNDDNSLLKLIRNRLSLDGRSSDDRTFTINSRMMIQGMQTMGLVPKISIFKPHIAKYMAMKYSDVGDIVGDYSAGFGARLLGVLSCGRKYIGTDPLTVPELIKMKEFYNFSDDDCKLIHLGSEYYKGEENSVDLYWSSLPYYNQEIYSNDLSQAYNNGEDYFYNIYWKKTLENIKYMLKPGKWFGLNVRNYPKMLEMAQEYFGDIVEIIDLKSTRNHLTKIAGEIKYEGIFMFKNNK